MRSTPRKRRPRFRFRNLSLRSLLGLLLIQVLCIAAWLITWPPPVVQLSFVVPQEEVAPWKSVIASFEAEHPNIQILLDPLGSTPANPNARQANFTTNDLEDFYKVDIKLKSAKYDLVYMDIIWTAKFQDDLVDLQDWIERDGVDLDDFLDSEVKAGNIDQHQYRLPMHADIGLLYYRTDLWDSEALPADLEELAQSTSQLKATDTNNQGYLWQGSSYEGLVVNFMEVMSSFEGAFWIDEQTQAVGLTQPATLAAVKALQQLIQKGISPEAVTNYTEQSSLKAFQRGQATFLRGWPYFQGELKEMDWGDEVAIAQPLSLGSLTAQGCRGGWGFGIPKNATHKEAAWEAIQYFTSESAQKTFAKAGYLPSRQALFEDPDIVNQHPQIKQLFNYLNQENPLFRPSLREYDEASAILQTALSEILLGQTLVEEAMATAQKETEELLQS